MIITPLKKNNEHRLFVKLRRPIGSSDLHRKGSWHQILRLWRSLGHREATRRASRRSPRAPKSRSIEPVEWLWALKESLAAPKEVRRGFLRANMKLEETQKSFPESLTSLENYIQIENVDVHETMEETEANPWCFELRGPDVSSYLLRRGSQTNKQELEGTESKLRQNKTSNAMSI